MTVRFSIIFISHNQAAYVGAALESVQRSTFQDWEILCVDDGSTDGTLDVLRNYASNDPRISVQVVEHSGKPSVSRNAALPGARGEYLCFLDGDDLYDPRRLQLLDEAITATANTADVLFHDYADFRDGTDPYQARRCLDGTDLGADLDRHRQTRHTLTDSVASELDVHTFAPFLLARSFVINTGTVCIRHEHFITRAGRFPIDRVMGEDTVVWFRCVMRAKVVVIDATLFFWRKYRGSITSTRTVPKQREIAASLEEMERELALPPGDRWSRAIRQRVYEENVEVGVLLERDGHRRQAIASYLQTALEFRRVNPVSRAAKALIRTRRLQVAE